MKPLVVVSQAYETNECIQKRLIVLPLLITLATIDAGLLYNIFLLNLHCIICTEILIPLLTCYLSQFQISHAFRTSQSI